MYDSSKNESEFQTREDDAAKDKTAQKSEAKAERKRSVGTTTVSGTVISDMPGAVVREVEVKREDTNYQEVSCGLFRLQSHFENEPGHK